MGKIVILEFWIGVLYWEENKIMPASNKWFS